MREMECLRCQAQMRFLKREKIQLGQTGAFFGDWPNILAGSLDTEIYYCPRCGKMEFFMPDMAQEAFDFEEDAEEELPPEVEADIVGVSMHGVPQVRCPKCGRKHDFDYPKCIYCNHDYHA